MNDFYIPPKKNTRIAAIDLDGTLCYSTWEPDQRRSVIGDPIVENVLKLEELVHAGYAIWIHTARHWSDHDMIVAWLAENHIAYDRVICGKLLADIYCDDKAVQARNPHWGKTW